MFIIKRLADFLSKNNLLLFCILYNIAFVYCDIKRSMIFEIHLMKASFTSLERSPTKHRVDYSFIKFQRNSKL